ncbi:oligosaccharide flippase family protein [Halobacillus litoralis]|uniref:Oligosaccharide flippase family protein n=1 Tax=Halobacillus litoralis TaxID=45668 RepID=A0A845E357_9BACI|nr:oligosaccharide flippase family protein [Halobacillus litoralis]MYL20104.1 oligosaccharide flippase family protein [Halobacillus litoralis]
MFKTHVFNLSYLFSTKIISTFFAFFAQILIARLLTTEDYGVISFYIILINICATLNGFGIGKFWMRRFTVEGNDAYRWIVPSVKSLLFLTIITLPIYLFIPFFSLGVSSFAISLTLLPLLLFQSIISMVVGKFQVKRDFKGLSFFEMIKNTIFMFSSFILFFLEFNAFIISYAVLATMVLVYSIYILTSFYHSIKKSTLYREFVKKPSIQEVLSTAWPYGIQGLLYMLYYQVDIILITLLLGATDTGFYNAAFTLISFIFIFPSLLFQVYLLPKSNSWIVHKNVIMTEFIRKNVSLYSLLIGIFIMIGFCLGSEYIIMLLYGNSFSESISILQILALSIPFRFVSNSLGVLYVTEKMVSLKVYIQGGGAIFNIMLNLVSIPFLGVMGAALSTVITEVIVVVLLYLYSNKVKKEM